MYSELHEIQLVPHVGAGPFRLGVPFSEAVAIAEEWGCVKVSGPTTLSSAVKAVVLLQKFEIVLLFDDGGVLSGVELWRFQDEDADVVVKLNEVDVFRTPQDDLQVMLGEWGQEVEVDEAVEVPELGILFANESSQDFPVDEDGDPLYFDYVLLAGGKTP